jgi:hypothetical protein
VARFIDQMPIAHFADFVDGVAKLKAAIFGVNLRLSPVLVLPIHIDDAWHVISSGCSPSGSTDETRTLYLRVGLFLKLPDAYSIARPLFRRDAKSAQFTVKRRPFHADKLRCA